MTGNNVRPIRASQGTLKFSTSQVTYDGSNPVGSETYANTVIQCKNITVTPPKGETEIVHLIGQSATTVGAGVPATGSFQNNVFDEKSFGEASMTCTLVVSGSEAHLPDFIRLATGTGTDVSSYKRHTFGDTTTNKTRNKDGAVILVLDNGYERMDILLNEPYFNVGDVKPTGMDGHFEIDFEAKCLPQDFVIDVKEA